MNGLKTKKKERKKKSSVGASNRLKTLLLSGPTMTLSQYQSFLKTREVFEQWKLK
jgi:hypothetical protein